MSRLNPSKLLIRYLDHTSEDGIRMPRRYTLTHSDSTGDLFLGIGSDLDRSSISGLYTRLMRDEVLAEWMEGDSGIERWGCLADFRLEGVAA